MEPSKFKTFLRPQTENEKIIEKWQKKRAREREDVIPELKYSLKLHEEQTELLKQAMERKDNEFQALKNYYEYEETAPEADDKTLCLAPSISILQLHRAVINELDEIKDKYGLINGDLQQIIDLHVAHYYQTEEC